MAATDFQEVANLRMLWTPLGAQVDLRTGLERNGQTHVIEFYGKGQGRQEIDMPGIRAGALKIKGFCTRWSILPAALPMTITAAERTGSTATLTFASTVGQIGQRMVVAGLSGAFAPLNGSVAITAITATTISYTTATSGAITAGAAAGTAQLIPLLTDWLAAGAAWPWEEGGQSPEGFMPGAEGPALWGDLEALPEVDGEHGRLTILEIGGTFGFGGIGKEIRAEAGDGFVAGFSSLI
jgi:hypothetical protein